MLDYSKRDPKLIHPSKFKGNTIDEWYIYLINDWIPNQPDFEELMSLFIDCGFRPAAFMCLVNPTDNNLAYFHRRYGKSENNGANT